MLPLDSEVLLPVLRRPNPVRRRLCGLRQFFDEMFCLSVGKAYRSEKGVRGPAYKSSSTDFDGEKMDTIPSCLEIHCEIQILVALQSIAKIHPIFPRDLQFNQDEGVRRLLTPTLGLILQGGSVLRAFAWEHAVFAASKHDLQDLIVPPCVAPMGKSIRAGREHVPE